ncbi:MAG: MBL fold metallo-hydrolase [Gemmatimonadota bacterium]
MVAFVLASLSGAAPVRAQAQELTVRLVGNAGVELTDGAATLLVDLPYESGAFGYERYDPGLLEPAGAAVSVVTHHHRDHFDPSLFLPRSSWRIVGPPSLTTGLPPERVLAGDSVTVGAFAVVAIPSAHTPDHRSYRIRWRGRVLHFTGDTEDPATVPSDPRIDVLFVTPWLQSSLSRADRAASWDRAVLYHRRPDGSDEVCGPVERLEQGARFTMAGG